MKWLVFLLLLLTNSLYSKTHKITQPEINWDEAVTASQTKKYISPHGREWEFRFHMDSSTMPNDKNYEYFIRRATTELEQYEPGPIVYAAYDIYRKKATNKENQENEATQERSYYFGLTFYLITRIDTQN